MPLRLEAFHDPFPSPDWLMGIFRPIVQPFVGAVLDTRHNHALCSVIGPKLVGDHHPRRQALALQQLAHQTLRRFGIASALHDNLQNKAILIYGAPEPCFFPRTEMTASSRCHLSPS